MHQLFYFFDDIIDIENFNLSSIKLDEKSYKNIYIYYIGYVTIKEYLKIYSVNLLYLIFRYANGYFEEINGNKYSISSITRNSEGYDKKYMKIKFNSGDEFPLNKTVEIPTITIVVRVIFLKNKKYYP